LNQLKYQPPMLGAAAFVFSAGYYLGHQAMTQVFRLQSWHAVIPARIFDQFDAVGQTTWDD